VARADDGDDVLSVLSKRHQLMGDVRVALVDERLRAARRKGPELLHHDAHHVGVGEVRHLELLDLLVVAEAEAVGGQSPEATERDADADADGETPDGADEEGAQPVDERGREAEADAGDEANGEADADAEKQRVVALGEPVGERLDGEAGRDRENRAAGDPPEDERSDADGPPEEPDERADEEAGEEADDDSHGPGVGDPEREAADHPELLDDGHPRPEALDGRLDVAVDERDVDSLRFGGVDRREHVRARRDVELLAQLGLDVREHPVGDELKDRVAREEVARFDVVGGAALQLAVASLVEFDGDDVRALGPNRLFDLGHALFRDVCGPHDLHPSLSG